MSHPFLSIQKITKIFSPTKELQIIGLKDISLEINRAEFVVISGPSGSGKTTLLNIIGGLDSPSSGNIFLDGLKVTELSEKEWSHQRRDHVGFVFQAYNLIPVLTARENIGYIMRLQGKNNQHCQQRITDTYNPIDPFSIGKYSA